MLFRAAVPADAQAIRELIRSQADACVANADGSGAERVWMSASAEVTDDNIANPRYRYLVAMSGNELAGFIALRDISHVANLFVALHHQRQGVATRLWSMASAQARQNGNQGLYTVNASLGTVPVYERFGFVAHGGVMEDNGARFQPMQLIARDRPEFLFVYGSLRNGAVTGMAQLLARHSDVYSVGSVNAVMYDVNGYPGAVQSSNPTDRIVGEVHRFYQRDQLLEQLDGYEEYGQAFAAPYEFVRRPQPVQLQDGSTVVAWMYVYNRPVSELQRIDSGDYLKFLKR